MGPGAAAGCAGDGAVHGDGDGAHRAAAGTGVPRGDTGGTGVPRGDTGGVLSSAAAKSSRTDASAAPDQPSLLQLGELQAQLKSEEHQRESERVQADARIASLSEEIQSQQALLKHEREDRAKIVMTLRKTVTA